MAEGSSYVKLTKEQESLQNVTPGELNQPIDIDRVNATRCESCGQILPPSYQPPADEDWLTGICGCAEDPESCWTGIFCPCVLVGRNVHSLNEDISERSACVSHVLCVEGGMTLAALMSVFNGYIDPDTAVLIYEGMFFAWWMCGIYNGMARQTLQRKYHLKDAPCDPCLVHCCLHWCALCQEHREMKAHLVDNVDDASRTAVNPPPVQEMSAIQENGSPASSENDDGENGDGHNNLALQPI
ncbi:hypothetical protein NMG60_11029187 [Bertholletia excelsa]